MSSKIIILLHPGFEELEAVAPIDILRRAELSVVTASTDPTREVKGRNGITLIADRLLGDLSREDFDALVIPGGPGVYKLQEHEEVLVWLQSFLEAGKTTGLICAAPVLLKAVGHERDRRLTGHPSIGETLDLEDSGDVVVDGALITSRGAGTAVPFALSLVACLKDPATAREIAESICHPGQGKAGADE